MYSSKPFKKVAFLALFFLFLYKGSTTLGAILDTYSDKRPIQTPLHAAQRLATTLAPDKKTAVWTRLLQTAIEARQPVDAKIALALLKNQVGTALTRQILLPMMTTWIQSNKPDEQALLISLISNESDLFSLLDMCIPLCLYYQDYGLAKRLIMYVQNPFKRNELFLNVVQTGCLNEELDTALELTESITDVIWKDQAYLACIKSLLAANRLDEAKVMAEQITDPDMHLTADSLCMNKLILDGQADQAWNTIQTKWPKQADTALEKKVAFQCSLGNWDEAGKLSQTLASPDLRNQARWWLAYFYVKKEKNLEKGLATAESLAPPLDPRIAYEIALEAVEEGLPDKAIQLMTRSSSPDSVFYFKKVAAKMGESPQSLAIYLAMKQLANSYLQKEGYAAILKSQFEHRQDSKALRALRDLPSDLQLFVRDKLVSVAISKQQWERAVTMNLNFSRSNLPLALFAIGDRIPREDPYFPTLIERLSPQHFQPATDAVTAYILVGELTQNKRVSDADYDKFSQQLGMPTPTTMDAWMRLFPAYFASNPKRALESLRLVPTDMRALLLASCPIFTQVSTYQDPLESVSK